MAKCEVIGTDYAARISYTVTQNVEKNRSAVKVTKVELRSLKNTGFPAYIVGSITVNGVKTTTLELTDTTSCGISTLSKEYAGGGESSWSGFSSRAIPTKPLLITSVWSWKTQFSIVSASVTVWTISASLTLWKRRCSAAPLPPYPILFIWTPA